jgi:hypothetical protein
MESNFCSYVSFVDVLMSYVTMHFVPVISRAFVFFFTLSRGCWPKELKFVYVHVHVHVHTVTYCLFLYPV